MINRNNKKGFTIVELVIVILAAVLIPTFGGMISKANTSKALQEAKNTYSEDLALLDGQVSNYKKDKYVVYEKTSDTTLAPNKTYYTKDSIAIATPVEKDIEDYCEKTDKSITKGEFDGAKYTYKTSKYTCTYENGTWDIAEVK
jgi:type II secretory pathway pseudopilin PulG